MSLLLDSHVLLWWLSGEPMEQDAIDRIADARSLVVVSSATVWELAIKRAIGKLRIEGSIVEIVSAGGFEPLAISGAHAELAAALPMHHRDPFDRMLIAQAQHEGLSLVTRDEVMHRYDVAIVPC